MAVLVTGSNGFIGAALCRFLREKNIDVIAASRRQLPLQTGVSECNCGYGSLDSETDFRHCFEGVDVIVHLAARAHRTEVAGGNSQRYFQVNRDATLNLARQAATAGVRRLVFVSSVKVLGEGREETYSELDLPAPQDAYGQSKWEAEQGLVQIAEESDLEIVVLRIPLVYGPLVKANFLKLFKAVESGIPLPLAAVKNQRSLIALENLLDAIFLASWHPAAKNQTFLLSDGENLSTPQLIRKVAIALERRAMLFWCPVALLRLMAVLTGRSGQISRLLDSLTVDSSRFCEMLDWQRPVSMQQELQRIARWVKGESPL